MKLLDLLKQRKSVAESFTKEFQDEVKRCVKDYSLAKDSEEKLNGILNIDDRYEFKIPYIFATHESMLSSMFDKAPDLIFRGRGMDDQEKEEKVRASYEYLVDKLDIEHFMNQAAWWFILVGWATSHGSFKSETKEVPIYDKNEQPATDEMGNPLTRTEYIYNDPVLDLGDPLKEYFSPESQFTNRADKVPFFFREEMMTVEEVKNTYSKKVEADATIKVTGIDEEKKEFEDIKRVKVNFYYGSIPEDVDDKPKGWKSGADCYIVFTDKENLYEEVVEEKNCRLGKWHGSPNDFFGFGIGKTLREFQKELSIRRGQQVRYADLLSHPKIAVDLATEYDEKALIDPRLGVVLQYSDKPPEYLTPPPMSQTIMIAEQKAREDAQFVSGMTETSRNGQESSIVKTATGQTIFAEAAEKRTRQMKRQFGRFYRETIIMLLKLAQKYWDEEKLLSITDSHGEQKELTVSKNDLKDINFDTDIDIDMESVSVNKEALRAQAIELYQSTKDDPLIDRRMVFKDTLRDGFNKKNPESYMVQDQEMGQMPMQGQPMGMPLADPMNAQVPTGVPNGL